MALQSMLGRICDPVAARVEIPCLGKNVIAASNAMSCANMALAGFDAMIPFDEVVDAAQARRRTHAAGTSLHIGGRAGHYSDGPAIECGAGGAASGDVMGAGRSARKYPEDYGGIVAETGGC